MTRHRHGDRCTIGYLYQEVERRELVAVFGTLTDTRFPTTSH